MGEWGGEIDKPSDFAAKGDLIHRKRSPFPVRGEGMFPRLASSAAGNGGARFSVRGEGISPSHGCAMTAPFRQGGHARGRHIYPVTRAGTDCRAGVRTGAQ